MQKVKWHNQASSAHIPAGMQPVLEQIIGAYRKRYGADLFSIYVNGSIVRGEWRPDSDIDVIGFVHSDVRADDDELALMLSKLSLRRVKIDPLTISDWMRHNPGPRIQYRLMILAMDGLRVWGETIDLSGSVPDDPTTFASRLYFDFKTAHAKYQAKYFDGSPDMRRRAWRLRKMIVRLAQGVAILKVGPHSSSYQSMLAHIEQFAPEWYEAVRKAYLLQKDDISAAEYRWLIEMLGKLIKEAERLGTTFLAPGTATR